VTQVIGHIHITAKPRVKKSTGRRIFRQQ